MLQKKVGEDAAKDILEKLKKKKQQVAKKVWRCGDADALYAIFFRMSLTFFPSTNYLCTFDGLKKKKVVSKKVCG